MSKTIFTHVSPKAVVGMRRVYERSGADIDVLVGSDGNATVVVRESAKPKGTTPSPKPCSEEAEHLTAQ